MTDLPAIIQKSFHACVRKHFPGGFNPTSLIDGKKFARVFPQFFSFPFKADYADESALLNLAEATCIAVGHKFYAVATDADEKIKEILNELQTAGFSTFYFELLYNGYACKFRELGILSPEILAGCLRKYLGASLGEEAFSLSEEETMESEIARRCKKLFSRTFQ